jgi:hypothetical protein
MGVCAWLQHLLDVGDGGFLEPPPKSRSPFGLQRTLGPDGAIHVDDSEQDQHRLDEAKQQKPTKAPNTNDREYTVP